MFSYSVSEKVCVAFLCVSVYVCVCVVPAHPVAECYLVCYCASLAAIETLW